MSGNYRQIRDMARESMSIKKEITRAKNQLHALKYSKGLSEMMKQMKEEQIEFYKHQLQRLRVELLSIAKQDSDLYKNCLLYTSDAADERSSVDLGGRRIINKKKKEKNEKGRRPAKQKTKQDKRQQKYMTKQ